jgi:hypothetical protein
MAQAEETDMERISLQKRDRLHQGNGLPESPRNGPRSENRPARRFRIALIALAVLFLPLLSPSPIPAREDSARLRLKMTAGDTKTRIHIVKKGEWIHDILRNEYGGEPVPYALVRRLNPRIPNLNRIYPGQRIRLPVRGKAGSSPPATELRTGSVSPAATYRIRNGDSISRILLGEMEIPPEEALATYRLIREMNPAVDNMAELPAGQLLKLPPGLSRPSPPAPEPLRPPARIAEKAPDPLPAVAPSSGEVSLGIIPAVIGRMKGSVTAKGNYFIPLAENSQVTIDCSLIPVVEMDDGTTVLLDFGNRLSEPLKGLIRTSWPNYAFLGAEELREDLSALQRIVNQSKGYRMARSESPMVLFSRPEVQVSPDWIITGAGTRRDAPYRQGIFLLREGETPFRPEIRAFLDKSGFVATEISKNQALAPPVSPSATETVTDLSGFKGIAFAVELLALLEMQAVRGAEIAVFEQARDGFSLSVTADLLLRRGGKQFVFRTKRLPDQFVRILNDAGTEVILLGEKDRGRSLIEGVLRGLGIPVSFGYFSFRIPEDSGRPRISATLPALRTESGGKTLYLIDFELPPDAISLLRDRRGGRVVRY